jgi:DNA-binding CsgD family transcriptional regulator
MKDILEQTRKKPFRGIQKRIADQLGIHPQTVNNALLGRLVRMDQGTREEIIRLFKNEFSQINKQIKN